MMRYPWRIDYHDGSGNGYCFSQAAEGEDICFHYTPVQKEHSSSGVYSGGEACECLLDDAIAVPLWAWLETLCNDTQTHVSHRMMGTGALRVQTGETLLSCIISDSDILSKFQAFIQQFKRK